MTETYTHTTWQVKPGMEAEFVRRWGEWAEWSHRQGLGAHLYYGAWPEASGRRGPFVLPFAVPGGAG